MKKILIVDDEDLIVKVLSLRLTNDGYKILTAFDGNEGFEIAIKEKPELAIIDIGLPKIDGNTLCEILKKDKRTKHIKIIVLTGKKLVGDMEKAFESGADAYISKPYEYSFLLTKIKKLIGD
ncbi:MAG: response regulator [Elusimicrobiales bacterium]|nr:response regulator [Elusimicrobiales bacterium]